MGARTAVASGDRDAVAAVASAEPGEVLLERAGVHGVERTHRSGCLALTQYASEAGHFVLDRLEVVGDHLCRHTRPVREQ
ncbi:hypothetical protein ACWDZ4_10715 [Streptomyces sp. NPDC003016]